MLGQKNILRQPTSRDCTRLVHFYEAQGLASWLELDPVPAEDGMLHIITAISSAWRMLRTPRKKAKAAMAWRGPVKVGLEPRCCPCASVTDILDTKIVIVRKGMVCWRYASTIWKENHLLA